MQNASKKITTDFFIHVSVWEIFGDRQKSYIYFVIHNLVVLPPPQKKNTFLTAPFGRRSAFLATKFVMAVKGSIIHKRKTEKEKRQKDRKTERQKDRKTERQTDRKTERQKDRKTERQKNRKTERQKDRKTER